MLALSPLASPRGSARVLVVSLLLLPLASNPALHEARALHRGADLDWVVRTAPAVLGGLGGWFVGAPLGLAGKLLGAYVGYRVGRMIGGFLANTVGAVFHDPFSSGSPWGRDAWPPPPGYGYGYGYGYRPFAPSAPGDSLTTLRDDWLVKMKALQKALGSGTAAEKEHARTELDEAQRRYYAAKADAAR